MLHSEKKRRRVREFFWICIPLKRKIFHDKEDARFRMFILNTENSQTFFCSSFKRADGYECWLTHFKVLFNFTSALNVCWKKIIVWTDIFDALHECTNTKDIYNEKLSTSRTKARFNLNIQSIQKCFFFIQSSDEHRCAHQECTPRLIWLCSWVLIEMLLMLTWW